MLTTPELVQLAKTFDPTVEITSSVLRDRETDRTVFAFKTFESARDFYDATVHDTHAVGYPFPQDNDTCHVVTRSKWS